MALADTGNPPCTSAEIRPAHRIRCETSQRRSHGAGGFTVDYTHPLSRISSTANSRAWARAPDTPPKGRKEGNRPAGGEEGGAKKGL